VGSDGTILSGDEILLRAWTGGYVGHQGGTVAARDRDHFGGQHWAIKLAGGGEGPIESGSRVVLWDYVRGAPLVVDDPARPGGLYVAPTDDSSRLELIIESAPPRGGAPEVRPTVPPSDVTPGELLAGSEVFLTVPRTDRRLTTEGNGYMHAHWDHRGLWQRFVVEEVTPRVGSDGTILSGDEILLRAWTGGYVGHQGGTVAARDRDHFGGQHWAIKLAGGGEGPIESGSRVVLWDYVRGAPLVVDDPARPGGLYVAPTDDSSRLELIIESAPPRGGAPEVWPTVPPSDVTSGEAVFFTVPRTHRRLTVERDGHLHTHWDHRGAWQRFIVARTGSSSDDGTGTELSSGERVTLRTWMGSYVGYADGVLAVGERDPDMGQEWVITLADGSEGTIVSGRKVVLRESGGRPLAVDFPDAPGGVSVTSDYEPYMIEMVIESASAFDPTTRAPSTTAAPTSTTVAPTTAAPSTTPSPTTTTPAPTTQAPTTQATTTQATLAPTTPTTHAPTTSTPATTLAAMTSTPAPTTTTPAPTTSTLAPMTTPAPTMPAPTTTPEAGGLLSCQDLDASRIAEMLSVTTVQLPGALPGNCPGFGVEFSCRHGFYAATPHNGGEHALLYNDADRNAILVLFDNQEAVVQSKVIGLEKVRGLQFDPSGRHLVALMSSQTGVWPSPFVFVKIAVPSLEIVWTKPIESPLVGLEKWTPDNSDSIAVSEDRYVLHSAGNCRDGQWCESHQGDLIQVVDAATGERIDGEGKDWFASHSCKQMIGYNPNSSTFMLGAMGDAFPVGLKFVGFAGGRHYSGSEAHFTSWAHSSGRQGITQGAIKADPWSTDFASVWSHGPENSGYDKLYFSRVSKDVAFVQEPRQLFPGTNATEIGGNIVGLSPGRWLVAYTTSSSDLIKDYLKIFFDRWDVPSAVREAGGRLAIVDANGDVQGSPVDVSALGAPFPVETNHLVERKGGFGWVYMDGPGASTARIVRLRCDRP